MMNSQWELIIIVLLLRAMFAVGQIPFEVSSVTNITAIYGRNATLPCPFDDKSSDHNIAWIRYDTRTILSMHGQKVIQSNRYTVENKDGTFNLCIIGIVEEDEGTYICQINSEPMQNLVVHLEVMRSPRIENTQPAGNDEVTIESGGTVALKCTAQGNPKPTITWKRLDSQPLRIVTKDNITKKVGSVNGTSLILRGVRQIDSGEVICIAANGYPPIISHKFTLVVQYAPIITLHVQKVNLAGQPFANVVCKIAAVPLPDETKVSIRGIEIQARQVVVEKHLIEYHVERNSDFGSVIECSAKNSVGSSVNFATIPALEPIVKPPVRSTVTESNPLTSQKPTEMNQEPEPEIKMQSGENENVAGSYYREEKDSNPGLNQFISVVLNKNNRAQQFAAPSIVNAIIILCIVIVA